MAPDFEFTLKDGKSNPQMQTIHIAHTSMIFISVIAIFMLCGYETVIKGRGKTEFCKASIFDTEDWKNFEYFNDLIYHKVS
jgi:hypothetical protein